MYAFENYKKNRSGDTVLSITSDHFRRSSARSRAAVLNERLKVRAYAQQEARIRGCFGTNILGHTDIYDRILTYDQSASEDELNSCNSQWLKG